MNFVKNILKKLGFYNYSNYMESAMTQDNLQAMKIIGALGMFMAVILLFVSFYNPGYGYILYRVVNVVCIIVCGAVIVFMNYCRKHKLRSFHGLHVCMFFYIVYLTVNGMIVAVIDCLNNGGYIVFLTSQIMCFDLIMIPPFVTVIFCGINFIVFTAVMSHLTVVPLFKYVEVFVFYVTVLAVNYFHYRTALLKINKEEQMIDDNERLDNLSTTDALTQVHNRMGLRADFRHLRSDSLCVMMFDIDNFKKYNDSYGHDVGDEVLRSFAHVLTEIFGKENIYRFGGDEFLVIIDLTIYHLNIEQMITRTNFMYENIAFEKIERPTSSCGYVYGSCHDEDTLRKMIKASDIQLYKAKAKGKNQSSHKKFDPDEIKE